jgi:hypothetical protein
MSCEAPRCSVCGYVSRVFGSYMWWDVELPGGHKIVFCPDPECDAVVPLKPVKERLMRKDSVSGRISPVMPLAVTRTRVVVPAAESN